MIRSLAARLTAALAALALTLIAAPAAAQDTLIRNVNGYTIGADGELVRFKGLVVGPDGRIRQLVTGPIAPPAGIREVDGGGRTMLPGLIDAHGHVMGLGIGALQLDLSETTSLADAQAKIRAYAAANPNLPWIVGRGWNQE